jgi:hypothetical protein
MIRKNTGNTAENLVALLASKRPSDEPTKIKVKNLLGKNIDGQNVEFTNADWDIKLNGKTPTRTKH